MRRLFTEEDIKELQQEVELIRSNGRSKFLMENTQNLHFSTIEEFRNYYQSRPFEEFDKEFRGG